MKTFLMFLSVAVLFLAIKELPKAASTSPDTIIVTNVVEIAPTLNGPWTYAGESFVVIHAYPSQAQFFRSRLQSSYPIK